MTVITSCLLLLSMVGVRIAVKHQCAGQAGRQVTPYGDDGSSSAATPVSSEQPTSRRIEPPTWPPVIFGSTTKKPSSGQVFQFSSTGLPAVSSRKVSTSPQAYIAVCRHTSLALSQLSFLSTTLSAPSLDRRRPPPGLAVVLDSAAIRNKAMEGLAGRTSMIDACFEEHVIQGEDDETSTNPWGEDSTASDEEGTTTDVEDRHNHEPDSGYGGGCFQEDDGDEDSTTEAFGIYLKTAKASSTKAYKKYWKNKN